MSILEVRNLTKKFGGLTANQDVSMTVEKTQLQPLLDRMVLEKQPFLI